MTVAEHIGVTAARLPPFDLRPSPLSPLRRRIVEATRRPEPDCVPPLIEAARLDAAVAGRMTALAQRLVQRIRSEGPGRGIKAMIHEYALSSEEGVALMCLAEALLRIPDNGTRDALIRDKVSRGNWRAHLGPERSLFVNAASWGLMVTGNLTSVMPEDGLANALSRLIARGGEPVIRAGVDMAMRLMGEQFVTGQTIDEALGNSRKMERRGFLYSYDMLGEGAATAEDAERYFESYRTAIAAIGKASAGRGPIHGPGISVKLSALHPRYRRSQIDRAMGELLPRLRALALLASSMNIGLNIDAEESDRLDLSLDLLEALALDPALAGWDGIGFVVQAYSKRCPFVIDWLVDLGRRSAHRLMVRLVKGAYWDSEIKQAQIEGLGGYPVYTRKVYSDVSYLACAKKLLAAPDAVFPQFATHNAQTLAAIYEMAEPERYTPGQYEFQCLHGMGEQLYSLVVGVQNLDRPCRIYAPVGTHGTLLAYLVRRLLENGANTSFVNRIADRDVPIEALTADPVAVAAAIVPPGAPHPQIPLPAAILAPRRNSAGLDLAGEDEIGRLAEALGDAAGEWPAAKPMLADGVGAGEPPLEVRNPANRDDLVGTVSYATSDDVARAFALATPGWAPATERAEKLQAAADALEGQTRQLLGLIMREAGKTAANALAEVREAVDFLRYYAAEARDLGPETASLGVVVCISPWNFPLSIFTGQIAAALAGGNAVLAKPAEETPLIAGAMVGILHAAGVSRAALQLLPGDGAVGASLCAHPQVAGVAFTGSFEVARLINRQLAGRVLPNGAPIPLIAETGGINAMIVDSSALTEQVVADVLASAFDSAGQRCSALRLLCLQEDVADRTLAMLKGAMHQLRVGDPFRLATDLGPVITAEAAGRIRQHIDAMELAGHRVFAPALHGETARGTFVAPTLIELDSIAQLDREVFGPVLHVVRYDRENLMGTVDAINALGYGLTFGLHTRLDETIARVTGAIDAGNIYVNRNIIGAVVGVQPFGGHALSGTGPKAGGPLYLRRFLAQRASGLPAAEALLPGPVGERNLYRLAPRHAVLLLPQTAAGLAAQLEVVRASGSSAMVVLGDLPATLLERLPPALAGRVRRVSDWTQEISVDSVLCEGDADKMAHVTRVFADRPGPIIRVLGAADYNADCLVREISISINTAAAGGNASLMALGEG